VKQKLVNHVLLTKIDKEFAMIDTRNTYWLLKPFAWLWNLIATIILLTGRSLAVILGLVLMLVGVILTITVIGAIVGIPLFIIGLLLVVRGFW
jgi:hypothetical protein